MRGRVTRGSKPHPQQGHNRLGILWTRWDGRRAYCEECGRRLPFMDCSGRTRTCTCGPCDDKRQRRPASWWRRLLAWAW